MASGTITGTTSNQYIDSKIEWSSVGNINTNTSEVTATLYYRRNNAGYETFGEGNFSITIGGKMTRTHGFLTITDNTWVEAISATETVTHNSAGIASVYIEANGSIGNTSLEYTKCGASVALDQISRPSTISSAADVTLGNKCSIKWYSYSSLFKFKVKFSLGNWSYTTDYISPNVDATYTYTGYTIPLDVANQITSSKTGTMTATLDTYNGFIKLGSSSKTFTVTVPSNSSTQPTVSMTVSPVSSLSASFDGLYIKGYTKVHATCSGSAKYGASMSYYDVNVNNATGRSPYTSAPLNTVGSTTVVGIGYDSRGISQSVSKTISVIDYSTPKVVPASGESGIVCERCDEHGNITPSGTYLKIKAKRSYSKVVSDGKQYNFCGLSYQYKASNASNFSDTFTLLDVNASSDEVNSTPLRGEFSASVSYEVRVIAWDKIGNSTYATFTIPTDSVYMHRDGARRSIAFGKYVEHDDAVEIADGKSIYHKGKCIEPYSLKGNPVIPTGSDLNDYKTPCVYAIAVDEHTTSITNMPPVNRAGLLVVYAGTGQEYVSSGAWKYIVQEYRPVIQGLPVYRRLIQSDESGAWSYGEWECGDTGWKSLGFSSSVTKSTANYTRSGHGCFYKVVNNNHVYVAFNCAFTHNGSAITVNGTAIPSAYRPKANAYGLCPTSGYGIAQVHINTSGNVNVTNVKDASNVTWIDGYIDYWL